MENNKTISIQEAVEHINNGGAIENDNNDTQILNLVHLEALPDDNYKMPTSDYGKFYYINAGTFWVEENTKRPIIKLSQITSESTEKVEQIEKAEECTCISIREVWRCERDCVAPKKNQSQNIKESVENTEKQSISVEEEKIKCINDWVDGYSHLELPDWEKNCIRVDYSNGYDQGVQSQSNQIKELTEALKREIVMYSDLQDNAKDRALMIYYEGVEKGLRFSLDALSKQPKQ